MYASEHGPNAHDEINVIEAGRIKSFLQVIRSDASPAVAYSSMGMIVQSFFI